MGEQDKNQFRSAVTEIKKAWVFEEWDPAIAPLTRLAMFDMLPVIKELGVLDRSKLASAANISHERKQLSDVSYNRIQFAYTVVERREIADFGIGEGDVNDGREFLGCTRLNDTEVRRLINETIEEAKTDIQSGDTGKSLNGIFGDRLSCCGSLRVAWIYILVPKRRASPRASLNANLAAVAHYMLARYHVCAALASQWQMDKVVEGYDNKKRNAIATGDVELKSMALTPGNPPFPPDFGIQKWAKIGSAEGDADRLRCNSRESLPLLIPEVNGSDA